MPEAARRPWSERALAQLILVRVREFMREPEAVFWTFAFPVLMTAGLRIAFRSKPEGIPKIAVLAGAAHPPKRPPPPRGHLDPAGRPPPPPPPPLPPLPGRSNARRSHSTAAS